MSYGILISSSNYSGQIGTITYYPDTGGTVNIGAQIMPYTFTTDYYYGSYEIYFSGNGKTCYAFMDNPSNNFLLQENFGELLQEDNSNIELEGIIGVELTGEYSPGSVNVLYKAVANSVVQSDLEISFTDTLLTLSGSPFVINGSVIINSGSTSGTSYYSVVGNYNNLSKVGNFSDITYSASGISYVVDVSTNSEFDVTPTPTASVTPSVTPSLTPTITVTPTSTLTPTITISPTPSVTLNVVADSFTTIGTTTWTAPAGVTSIEYLVVGGGGGGGNGYDSGGGGGGAGGMVLTGTMSVVPGNSYTVTVGSGGIGGADTRANNNGTTGDDSVFDTITALGGIYGGGSRTNNPGPAGVGAGIGGAAQISNTTAARGGNGGGGGSAGGGGGGATGAGTNRISSSSAGVGGAGLLSTITGVAVTYGVGGNGGTANVNNNNGAVGAANTGNGGGAGSATGSNSGGGGNGGSGIVVLKYNYIPPTPSVTPTITQSITPTPSVTPSATVSITPSVTNSVSVSVTPTPTITPTNSITPSITPTPSVTPIPVTGYGFNLVALPYNVPSSGNTIFSNNNGGGSIGSLDPNSLSGGTSPDGIYWNAIDINGIDRTDYFSGFTGQSVTLTMSQNGVTVVYSGNTGVGPNTYTFGSWFDSGGGNGSGFNFLNGGNSQPERQAILIQSASTQWVTGQTVYISAEINIPPSPTPTPTPTLTVTPTITPTPSVSSSSGSVTGGTGTLVSYTTGTFFDAYSSQAGVTSTDAFNTNNGCWQLYYAHQTVTISTGTNNIGLNPHTSGTNSWTWYYAISNSTNTIGNWGSVTALSGTRSGGYTGGVLSTTNITANVTIPAGTYFLIANSGGPYYRTVKTLADNRTATVSGNPYVTAINQVCLGNWPSGGTTTIPTQFGGSGGLYTLYDGYAHVHSVTFG